MQLLNDYNGRVLYMITVDKTNFTAKIWVRTPRQAKLTANRVANAQFEPDACIKLWRHNGGECIDNWQLMGTRKAIRYARWEKV
jgi:hypothetical protein